ncbi:MULTISPECIES: type I DNA topoisomerase [Cetobacterium]|jgi:DNA topoisomerase-1|uniref:DNA topoisomerase 1 n=1 Tax=Candidatus Cetobacterium colombiensis TaxID=3073100 RepID=A0ABU4WA14_9FUSO|nr:type I DNA topoisomerase [Candidatus Cetobacterium colombiensis]MDX8336373.1 type I DNA topoisomerase [Candidatus Cetobacterium colombiensis]
MYIEKKLGVKAVAKKNLVIVESPAKAKTIEKILGKNFHVTASFGHVRDLPKSKIGVDVKDNFKPSYSTIRGKGDVIKTLKDLAKKSNKVYLASDPDREGEAIAWHIAQTLKLDEKEANRIEFNEITNVAIREAIKNPRKVDINRVNAQQARRILDRLVGYEISPLLWKTISSNTSAGRVQSVALKLICDLEDKIRKFIPEKFWDIKGEFENKMNLSLYKIEGKRFERVTDEDIVKNVQLTLNSEYSVINSKVTKKSKNPPLPLKTSTLQQLASSYLGFSASKTMSVAQGLYEGISIDGTQKGLITYMRTDSTRISDEAKEMAKSYILENFGKEYLGKEVVKKKKDEKIQDAHEAVRPTEIYLEPDKIKKDLTPDQYKLYKLIWERFMISQLAPMQYEQFEIILENGDYQFRGTLNKIIFDGYYKVFKDDEELPIGEFPNINEGDFLKLKKLNIKEDWTKPPSRLTESSLVKKLEADGIGRPSTYASIIETLKKREYVLIEGKSFVPTELGYEIKSILEKNFKDIMDVKFTASLEDGLDSVEEGERDWIEILKDFYSKLSKDLELYKIKVEEESNRIINSDVPCPCGKGNMVMKNGRFGRYLCCTDENCKEKYSLKGIEIPLEDIKNGSIKVKTLLDEQQRVKQGKLTDVFLSNGSRLLLKLGRFGSYLESENFKDDNERVSLPGEIKKLLINGSIEEIDGIVQLKWIMDKIQEEETEILKNAGNCEKCGKPFKIGRGRWGKFLACTGYPECKNIKKLENDKKSK